MRRDDNRAASVSAAAAGPAEHLIGGVAAGPRNRAHTLTPRYMPRRTVVRRGPPAHCEHHADLYTANGLVGPHKYTGLDMVYDRQVSGNSTDLRYH